jgi:hypothetical protein
MTESGKSTLGKQLSRDYKKAGIGVLVLDPFMSTDWHADIVTSDPDHFLNVVWDSQSCAVFIDEAADSVGRYDDAMRQTATRGRHWGHNMHYLSQRGQDLAKTVRDQCSKIFLFSLSLDDRKILAREFNEPRLLEPLEQFEYFEKGRFTPLEKRQVIIGA